MRPNPANFKGQLVRGYKKVRPGTKATTPDNRLSLYGYYSRIFTYKSC